MGIRAPNWSIVTGLSDLGLGVHILSSGAGADANYCNKLCTLHRWVCVVASCVCCGEYMSGRVVSVRLPSLHITGEINTKKWATPDDTSSGTTVGVGFTSSIAAGLLPQQPISFGHPPPETRQNSKQSKRSDSDSRVNFQILSRTYPRESLVARQRSQNSARREDGSIHGGGCCHDPGNCCFCYAGSVPLHTNGHLARPSLRQD